MGEKQTIPSERHDRQSVGHETAAASVEHFDEIEQAERIHKDKRAEREAVNEAKALANEKSGNEPKRIASPAERRRSTISKKQSSHAYDLQLEHAREHMRPAAKAFSKLIHNRAVETTSDAISSTIARPNALLSGSIAAFAVVTILYFVAKHYGYQLTGFETIGAFAVGWALGILFDYFSLLIRGR